MEETRTPMPKQPKAAAADEQEGASIKVAVRCRPMLPHESSDLTMAHCVAADSASGCVSVHYGALDGPHPSPSDESSAPGSLKQYRFNDVFDEYASNEDVYEKAVAPLVQQVRSGFDATFFAYGQVGSGKTHSICGIMPFVGRDLISFVEANNNARCGCARSSEQAASGGGGAFGASLKAPLLQLRAAYFELYNENIIDLLHDKNEHDNARDVRSGCRVGDNRANGSKRTDTTRGGRRGGSSSSSSGGGGGGPRSGSAASFAPAGLPTPRIREHPVVGVFVENLSTCLVESESDFLGIVQIGTERRATADHLMNARSSRSHSVLMLIVAEAPAGIDGPRAMAADNKYSSPPPSRAAGTASTTTTTTMMMQDVVQRLRVRGQLNLVDLAGSERAGRTGTSGVRLREGAAINKSLSCLGNVINALAAAQQRRPSPGGGPGKEHRRQSGAGRGKAPTRLKGGSNRRTSGQRGGACRGASASSGARRRTKQQQPTPSHIPFRDSALTRILQPSLLGNAHTTMLATVSPSIDDIDESLSTLDYAQCASQIKHQAPPARRGSTGGNSLDSQRSPNHAALEAKLADQATTITGLQSKVAELRRDLEAERAKKTQDDGSAQLRARLAFLEAKESARAADDGVLAQTKSQLKEAHEFAREQSVELERLRKAMDVQEHTISELRRKVKSRESYAREMEVVVRDATSVILRDATRNSLSLKSLKQNNTL